MHLDLSPASHEPMRPPAPARLVVVSMVIALLINLAPWSGWGLLVKPDFVLLMLLYWAMHESRDVGQGWAFVLGLVMDVADSVLLGQHALVYVAAVYLTQLLRLRLFQLSLLEQALHIGGILLVAQVLGILLNLSVGREFPGMLMIVSPVLGAMLWPPLHFIAIQPRLRRRDVVTLMR
jgi:rod shape-determining protein MreD